MVYETLVVGLGNPGLQYAGSRHNVGFMSVEAFASSYGLSGKQNNKMQAIVGHGTIKGHGIIVAQPLTFMNRSGEAVIRLKQYYQIPLERVLVIFDDVSIPFGKMRFRNKGSAGSHNGMRSIISTLGSQDFPRLRIGIDNADSAKWDLSDFVLSRFTPEEQAQLPKIISCSVEATRDWMEYGIEHVMNSYNSKDILNL